MSVFNTARPEDMELKYQKMIETANLRKERLRALRESSEQEKSAKELEKKLDDITKKSENDKGDSSDNYDVEKLKTEALKERVAISKLKLGERLITEGYRKCFDNAIFGIVYEAYWMDDDIKAKSIREMFETYTEMKELVESFGVKETLSTRFLTNVRDVVTETCKKACDRIAKENNSDTSSMSTSPEDLNSIDFSLSDDESLELTDDLSDLGIDDISELIKMKVLQVINDEKECGAKKAEVLSELNQALNEEDEPLGGDEDLDDIKDESNEESSEEETPTKESLSLSALRKNAIKRKMNRNAGASLFECLMIGGVREVSNIVATTESANHIGMKNKMDMAYADTILRYTILETFNTIGLYNIDVNVTRKLAEHFKNEKNFQLI